MTLSNEQIRNITKKIYLARLNIINYDAYYGILLMNLCYALSEENQYLTIEDRKLLINPLLIEKYDMAELEMDLITTLEKYLIKIGVYGNVISEDLLNYQSDESTEDEENDDGEEAKDGKSDKDEKDGENGEEVKDDRSGKNSKNGKNGKNGEGSKSDKGGEDGEEGKDGKGGKDGKSGKDGIRCKNDKNEINGSERQNGHNGKGKFWENGERRFWQKKVYETVKIIQNSKNRGLLPLNAERFVKEYEKKNVNWKEQLQEFIQFDISDYSFTPPDRRYDDSPFFLPDLNDEEEKIENILFMIDTSGSMSDETISMVYAEVKNCLEQFNEKVKGYVGCFDAQVYNVTEFSDIKEFKTMRVRGGGGTSFVNIFKYINEKMKNIELKCVIILTDGRAPYPDKKITKGMPILWLMTTNNKATIGKTVPINDNIKI